MFPFNSSNTAAESAAETSKWSEAVKRRFSPAGSSASSTILLSARMRTRVAADVEIDSSSGIAGDGFEATGETVCISTGLMGGAEEESARKSADCFVWRCALYLRQP